MMQQTFALQVEEARDVGVGSAYLKLNISNFIPKRYHTLA